MNIIVVTIHCIFELCILKCCKLLLGTCLKGRVEVPLKIVLNKAGFISMEIVDTLIGIKERKPF